MGNSWWDGWVLHRNVSERKVKVLTRIIDVIFNRLLLVKYRISNLRDQFLQKLVLLFLPVIRSCEPTKHIVELMACGNPLFGKNLVDGSLVFSGVAFEIEVDNPWLIESPSWEVERYLHGFCWLNDLSAYGNSKARRVALEWIVKWNFYNNIEKKIGWDPEIAALRSINFLRNLQFLNASNTKITLDCFRNLRRQYVFLSIISHSLEPGLKKLNVLYAIFMVAQAYNFSDRTKQKTLNQFCKVIIRHIDFEGQVLNRNPEELLECFIMINEILKIPKTSFELTHQTFNTLTSRKEAIAPILRGLRLGNGLLTRSHGGDTGSLDLIDRCLMATSVKSKSDITKLLGFERITAGRLTLLVDCAAPLYGVMGDNSHASCLSFELTSGQRPIFVNCGPGGRFGNAFKQFCRSTQAHNTCTLENISQSQFKFISKKKRWPREIIFNGPNNIIVDRFKTFEATWLDLCQDSYEHEYGYLHYRKLFMLNTGKVFTGTDIFEVSQRRRNNLKKVDNFYAYFQLHPDVEVWDHPKLQTIILRLKNGEHWIFEIDLGQVTIEESTFINSLKAYPENTKRIVIKSSTLLNKTEIKWSLRRREIVSRNTRDAAILQ